MRRDGGHVPVSAKTLARGLPEEAWRIVPWREGSNEILSSRASQPCASGRLRGTGSYRRPTRWSGFSSNGPRAKKSRRNTGFRPCPKTRPSTFSSTCQIALAHRARLRATQKRTRPRPFRRRSWRGFHHHAVLCTAAYGFLIRERAAIPPLRPPAAPNVSPILASQTQRRRQSDPNDMSKIRSPRSEDNSRSRSPAPSCAAYVAKLCHRDDPIRDHCDTVELGLSTV
jgi:hypothetical protein